MVCFACICCSITFHSWNYIKSSDIFVLLSKKKIFLKELVQDAFLNDVSVYSSDRQPKYYVNVFDG